MATKDKRAQTIPDELLQQWKLLKRHGDAAVLAKALGKSRPTIDNALGSGAVHDQEIIDGINKFFADRLKDEIQQGDRLKWLNGLAQKCLPAGAGGVVSLEMTTASQ